MDKVKLEAKLREERGKKVNKGRKQGLVPAVVYGKKVEPQSLWVNDLDLKRLLKSAGESVIIDLIIGGKAGRNVIFHEIQKDPLTSKYIHIDFFQVRMDEKIETEVELLFSGESPAVKESGGVFVRNIDKIKIRCLPADLPSHIDVDISTIKTFDDHIAAKDLKISDKVELEMDPETVIALVSPPRSEEELAQLEEKVEEDVTKVEGVVKEEAPAEEGAEENTEKKEEKEKKEVK